MNIQSVDEKMRPLIHYSPGRHWMNDPNGLVYYRGEYHLFYQHNPHGSQWGEMHWGHAVSADGIRWSEREKAISPHGDKHLIFSGCGVVDGHNVSRFFGEKGGVVLLYTGVTLGAGDEDRVEHQYIAYLDDETGRVIIPVNDRIIENPGLKDFRDPKVLRKKDRKGWIMVLACGDHIAFYTSGDLKAWSREGEFRPSNSNPDHVVECPGLFEGTGSDGRPLWVLYFSLLNRSSRVSETYYVAGTLDGPVFAPLGDRIHALDGGHDFYAPQHWDLPGEDGEGDGKPLWIGWMNNWAYANAFPGGEWNGIMSLVRETGLVEKGGEYLLSQRPLPALEGLRQGRVHPVREEKQLRMGIDRSVALEIRMKLHLERGHRVSLHLTERTRKHFTFSIDPESGRCTLDRSGCCLPEMAEKGLLRRCGHFQREDSPLDMIILLDNWTIEIFMNDGTLVFSELLNWHAFPDSLYIKTEDPDGTISDFACWELGYVKPDLI